MQDFRRVVVVSSSHKPKLNCYYFQTGHKSSHGRPKKKVYHRVPDLDKVMDLQKKPSLILQLIAIISHQKNGALLLRDLEKEVGFVQKWNFMPIIEKNPTIFKVTGGNSMPFTVKLTDRTQKIVNEEAGVRELMEPLIVKNMRKLLMMSMDCRIPMEKIELIRSELGLDRNYKTCLIPKFPQFFTVSNVDGKNYLVLENWDSSLAVTAREEKLDPEACCNDKLKCSRSQRRRALSKDGNYSGPFAFRIAYAPTFRPNMAFLEEVQKWQRLPFPSPYMNARRFDPADPHARKRAVAVLHEVLSLTMEKRLNSAQLDAFRAEYQLPCKLLLCLVKNHGIFYITNKGTHSTVFLKDAYNGSCLIDKCPLLTYHDKILALTGRTESSSKTMASLPSLHY